MNSVLTKEVSIFPNCVDPNPFDEILLDEWLQTKSYKKEVLKFRECENLNRRKILKKELPAITPSGIFSPTRKAVNMVAHSGLICIDIDSKDNPKIKDWQELKNRLSNIINIAYCGLSVSGKGAFALIPITYPEHHLGHFNALDFYFAVDEGIIIDTACKDVCRLRTISYDPNPYVNPGAQRLKSVIDFSNKSSPPKMTANDAVRIDSILTEIKNSNLDITSDYTDWFQIGCVIAKVFGEEGREKFHSVSQFHHGYNLRECNRQYNACLKKQYNFGIGTLLFIKNKYSND
jgi:hypothetical protein